VEMAYAVEYLTGARREPRMHEVTIALCTEMLLLGKLARTPKAARQMLQTALDSGAAAEKFAKMVAALGGPKKFVDNPWAHMDVAPITVAIHPERAGTVQRVDTRAIGMVVVALGGGRTRPQDPVDHAVGLTWLAGQGDHVGPDRPLALVHARNDNQVRQATQLLRAAYHLTGKPAIAQPAVIDRVTA
ncbi:MAG: thymidine phosphorylase, partial [Actinomycetota bacterium]